MTDAPITTPEEAEALGALLPCPFCGGVRPCIQNGQPTTRQIGHMQLVWCPDCGAASDECFSQARAAAQWNLRSNPQSRTEGVGRDDVWRGVVEVAVQPCGAPALPYEGGWRIVRSVNPEGPHAALQWVRVRDVEPRAGLPTDGETALDAYDAGLLNDYGGGNVDWWQDYLRAELGRAHDYYAEQFAALHPPPEPAALERTASLSGVMKGEGAADVTKPAAPPSDAVRGALHAAMEAMNKAWLAMGRGSGVTTVDRLELSDAFASVRDVYLAALQPQPSAPETEGWRSMDVEPPPLDAPVLAANGGDVWLLYWMGWGWACDNGRPFTLGVEHWRPVPASPPPSSLRSEGGI